MRFLLGAFILTYAAAVNASSNVCSLVRADFDGSGVVNFGDIALFVDCFLANTSSTPSCSFADMDQSGSVNFADYAVLTSHFLGAVPTDLPAPWLQNRVPAAASFSPEVTTFATADLNGDGLSDTIGIRDLPPGANEIFVAMNLGDFQYADPASWTPPQDMGSLWRFGDYNDDGTMDVASASVSSTVSTIYLNLLDATTGNTTLIVRQLFTESDDNRRLSTHRYVDVSGDGHVDMVGTYNDPNAGSGFNQPQGFFVFESTGAGQWQTAPVLLALNQPEDPPENRYDLSGAIIEWVRHGPLTGALLIAGQHNSATTDNALLVFEKRAGAYVIDEIFQDAFTTLYRKIIVDDYDGDGKNDVLYTDSVSSNEAYWLLVGTSSGTGLAPPVLVDFTQTGKLLQPIKDAAGQVYLPLSSDSLPGVVLGTLDQQGVFYEVVSVTAPGEITGIDISQTITPNKFDVHLVTSAFESYLADFEELLNGAELQMPQIFATQPDGFNYPADVDGDFDLDIVTTAGDLILNNAGVFAVLKDHLVFDQFAQLQMADINQDGNTDIVSYSQITHDVASYLGAGDLTFTETHRQFVPGQFTFRLADINGDGLPDAMFGSQFAPGNGQGGFLPTVSTGINEPNPRIADINNDGYADVLTSQSDPFRHNIFLNQGNGEFSSSTTYTIPYTDNDPGSYSFLILVDLNDDNAVDLVSHAGDNFGNTTANEIVISYGNGDGTFTATEHITDDSVLSKIGTPTGALDINKDGLTDLIGAVPYSNYISIVPNSPDGLLLNGIHRYASNMAYSGNPVGLMGDFTNSCTIDYLNLNGDQLYLYTRP